MREIAEQYRHLLLEYKMLKAGMSALNPVEYPTDAQSIIREIRDIRTWRIRKIIADITAFKVWVESIPDDFIKKAIVLRYVKGYTWNEVATQLGGGNSGDAVKHLCHRYFSRYGQRSEKTDTTK